LLEVFGSLQAKLTASYALIIVLTLILAGTGFTFLLRDNQARLARDQLADLALPLAFQVRSLERASAPATDIDQFLQDQSRDLNVRIFLVSADRNVMFDTGSDLIGQPLPAPTERRQRLGGLMQYGSLDPVDQPRLTYIEMTAPPERLTDRDPRLLVNLAVAVPENSLSATWLQLAPSLLAGAVVASVMSIAVAFWLARSISGPLAKVTSASERMATGDFDQFIDVGGRDEVGHLAASFNLMAREVGQMHRTMRDFLANVSHELRTPLTSIEGYSAAMVDGTIRSSDQYQDAARIIGDEAGRMHRLVEDLLYLSKIESGQISIDRAPLDLSDLLRGCLRQVQAQIDSAGLTADLKTSPVPTVLADGHRLQQVFVNLLDNAVKQTPPGGSIDIAARVASARPSRDGMDGPPTRGDQPWVAVDVHNTGSYITPEQIGRVFERFYQVDPSRSRRGDGNGLGLAIVHEIVQAHHGKVDVASDPEKGTTFTVFLPVA
jgi:two-component system OmpR family sensor kinase